MEERSSSAISAVPLSPPASGVVIKAGELALGGHFVGIGLRFSFETQDGPTRASQGHIFFVIFFLAAVVK